MMEPLGESPVLSILQGGLNRYLGFSLYVIPAVIESCSLPLIILGLVDVLCSTVFLVTAS